MIKCLSCGAENVDSNKFCSECGKSLENVNPFDFQLQKSETRGQNDPRRIDERQHVNNQQPYGQQAEGDPRRIDERYHVSNQQQTNGQQGNKDPRRIDERYHVSKNPQMNNGQQVNNQPQVSNQQQNTNRNTGSQSNGSIMDKISNLSLPVKIIGFIAICCIGILIVSSLMGGISDKGSLYSNDNNYQDNSYGSVFDSFNKADCKEINYKELNKNPDRYAGDNIKLKGRVMQISEGHSDGNYLLMYVNDNYDQLAYVEYYNDTNIVEGDYITVYGVCGGSYSYTTTIGGTNTVPSVYGAILQ